MIYVIDHMHFPFSISAVIISREEIPFMEDYVALQIFWNELISCMYKNLAQLKVISIPGLPHICQSFFFYVGSTNQVCLVLPCNWGADSLPT